MLAAYQGGWGGGTVYRPSVSSRDAQPHSGGDFGRGPSGGHQPAAPSPSALAARASSRAASATPVALALFATASSASVAPALHTSLSLPGGAVPRRKQQPARWSFRSMKQAVAPAATGTARTASSPTPTTRSATSRGGGSGSGASKSERGPRHRQGSGACDTKRGRVAYGPWSSSRRPSTL